jgi:3-keto-5-aminohexanoate cleavage enzyme
MEKLIITVACDSRTSYPHNHLCPPQEDIAGVAQQYVDAVSAGAAIAHIHGRRTLEETIQADGRQVSRIHHDDWKRLQDAIMNKVDPIMQFGVASARIEEKIKLMELGPDMMAVCFNAHDEYFQPEPSLPPKRMMAIHPVEELMAYAKASPPARSGISSSCASKAICATRPTPRCSSAGRAAPGRRRPSARCSSWWIICRRTASGT